MIFNNITQIKINGFLDSLKKMKIARPLSASCDRNYYRLDFKQISLQFNTRKKCFKIRKNFKSLKIQVT